MALDQTNEIIVTKNGQKRKNRALSGKNKKRDVGWTRTKNDSTLKVSDARLKCLPSCLTQTF